MPRFSEMDLCWYCGRKAQSDDHQIPQCQGGGGGANLVPACLACNTSKNGRTVERFRAYMQKKLLCDRNGWRWNMNADQYRYMLDHGFWKAPEFQFFAETGMAPPLLLPEIKPRHVVSRRVTDDELADDPW